ncbi:hypothetical protein VTI28DRAFT_5018 [Corynascus sepedonium]
MEFSNEGQSFYHRFQGAFLPDENGGLMHSTGPRRQWIRENWSLVQSKSRSLRASESGDVRVYQNCRARRQNKTAVVVNSQLQPAVDMAFEDFFVQLILDQGDLCVHSPTSSSPEIDVATEQIVDLFDIHLRYEGKEDRWMFGGREYFRQRVRHFTAQDVAVELCLPAFPCKSSNGDKVIGRDPDRGEELALERLHDFVEAIERVYQPGAKLWVISDGHVFSDCIGVDDADVDTYGEKLKQMNHAIGVRKGNTNRIGFKSLVDLFRLSTVAADGGLSTLAQRLNLPAIDHYVNTEVTEEAELCRCILMAGCGPQKSAVRARIESKDPAITALYRGFSRFMLEDLEHHPHTQSMTRSQQKKLSTKVAFEMIMRNQAYSNLVEMLFPNHVRLHNNAGPKFGIQLFDPSRVRTVQALSADGELMTSLDLLHIPTPWHNSVVQLAGSDVILVTKAKLARAALAAGSMTGGLVGAEEGTAHFALESKFAPSVSDPVSVSSSDPPLPPLSPAPVTLERAKAATDTKAGSAATVTVTVTEDSPERNAHVDGSASEKPRKTRPFSEKADAVLTAVVGRNTSSSSLLGREKPEPRAASHSSWFARLRWILSLFWPRGL